MLVTKHYLAIQGFNGDERGCPLPTHVITNYMGINLCSVAGIEWERQEDGQLVSLTIRFIPAPTQAVQEATNTVRASTSVLSVVYAEKAA